MSRSTVARMAAAGLAMAGILGDAAMSASAHEPFETAIPNYSHLHIKGRVTTPQSVGIGNARLDGSTTAFVRGWPGGCVPRLGPDPNTPGATMPTGAPRTASDGTYHFVVVLVPQTGTDPGICHDALPGLTVDKTKMGWAVGSPQ